MPSAKYDCSGSPLMLSNGRTAIEVLSAAIVGTGAGANGSAGEVATMVAGDRHQTTSATVMASAAAPAPSQRDHCHDRRAGATTAGVPSAEAPVSAYARTGSPMFLTPCRPRSPKVAGMRLFTEDATLHRAAHGLGNHDAARLGERLQAAR